MEEIFRLRPFKIRNADEYDLENILNLFVSPIIGLNTPFDFENNIIKGRMGSGKTMYLRANLAYYLYGLVPSLMENQSEIILPILIRLSDFQHITEPQEIYRSIIIKIIEELTSIYLLLQDAKKMAGIHLGFKHLSDEILTNYKFSSSVCKLLKLGCNEYIERITTELGLSGTTKIKFFEASAQWKESKSTELKNKPNPGIKDVQECYENLLSDQNGKILLLIDEAGSIDKKFFQEDKGSAFFEILMNQFRTSSFIRTKIAVYPNSYSDLLAETRYGDVIKLEDNIIDERGYKLFHSKVLNIINNYINSSLEIDKLYKPNEVFDLKPQDEIYGDCLEQIIYASNGNIRRLIQILDLAMNTAYKQNNSAIKINTNHVFEALKEHAANTESMFSIQDKKLLGEIVSVCKSRSAFKFVFPNMSPILYKYTSKSQEYNIINVDQLGSGRRGNIYSFDYSYAVLKDIPTHYINSTEKINRDRSLEYGPWINRVTQINQELVDQASLPGKIEGTIEFVKDDWAFIKGDDNISYFGLKEHIIEADKNKQLIIGRRVKFYPNQLSETKIASNIEILVLLQFSC